MHYQLICSLHLQVDFFQPNADVKFGTDGVMVVTFSDGRTSGDGFACFSNEQELTKALQLNKSLIGTRYVELFKCSQKELELVSEVVFCDNELIHTQQNNGCLRAHTIDVIA